ncbi:MAG: hypothetical protein COA78_35340 [Blastopirellula sp.]|nr:MAG: hypothetical protein COA78_35340 [Blastopirellula sp.]
MARLQKRMNLLSWLRCNFTLLGLCFLLFQPVHFVLDPPGGIYHAGSSDHKVITYGFGSLLLLVNLIIVPSSIELLAKRESAKNINMKKSFYWFGICVFTKQFQDASSVFYKTDGFASEGTPHTGLFVASDHNEMRGVLSIGSWFVYGVSKNEVINFRDAIYDNTPENRNSDS